MQHTGGFISVLSIFPRSRQPTENCLTDQYVLNSTVENSVKMGPAFLEVVVAEEAEDVI